MIILKLAQVIIFNKGKNKVKRKGCRKKFCLGCLEKHFKQALDRRETRVWECPSCLHLCFCRICKKLKKLKDCKESEIYLEKTKEDDSTNQTEIKSKEDKIFSQKKCIIIGENRNQLGDNSYQSFENLKEDNTINSFKTLIKRPQVIYLLIKIDIVSYDEYIEIKSSLDSILQYIKNNNK